MPNPYDTPVTNPYDIGASFKSAVTSLPEKFVNEVAKPVISGFKDAALAPVRAAMIPVDVLNQGLMAAGITKNPLPKLTIPGLGEAKPVSEKFNEYSKTMGPVLGAIRAASEATLDVAGLAKILGQPPPTIEQISEKSGGWKTGDKVKFDTALANKDASTIQDMLPRVPVDYKTSFANEIRQITGLPAGKIEPINPTQPGQSIFRGEHPGTIGGDYFSFQPSVANRYAGTNGNVVQSVLPPNTIDARTEIEAPLAQAVQDHVDELIKNGATHITDEMAWQPAWDKGIKAVLLNDHMTGETDILLNPAVRSAATAAGIAIPAALSIPKGAYPAKNPYDEGSSDTQPPPAVSQFMDMLGGVKSVVSDFITGAKEGAQAASGKPAQFDENGKRNKIIDNGPKLDFGASVKRYLRGGAAGVLGPGAKVLGDTINDTYGRAKKAFFTWTSPDSTSFERTVALGELGVGAVNALFSPITSVLQTATTVPGIGHIADGMNRIFGAIGGGAANVAAHAVDNAIQEGFISKENGELLKPLAAEAAGLVAQILAGEKAGEIGPRLVEVTGELTNKLAGSLHDMPTARGFIRNPFAEEPSGEKGKSDVTMIAAETDPAKISQMLKDMGVRSDVAEAFAPKLAEATDPERVSDILQTAKGTEDIVEPTEARGTPVERPPEREIPKTDTPAIVQAKTTKEEPQIDTSKYTPNSIKTTEAFNQSFHQEPVGKFELGTFGKNSAVNKADSTDRFPEDQLAETQQHIIAAYRASNDPTNYRSGNIAWIAQMPNGETRAIYTRLNANGKEEILNWHTVSNPRYVDSLAKFGIPERIRTSTLADRSGLLSPLSYGDNETIHSTNENVKTVGKNEVPPKPDSNDTAYTPGDFLQQLPRQEQNGIKVIVDDVATPNQKAHILDYAATPEYVLRKIGLGKQADGIREAYETYLDNRKIEIARVESWKNKVADFPENAKEIFRHLEGTGAREPFSKVFARIQEGGTKIPSEFDGLVKTANKYKTFEDFYKGVSSQEADLIRPMNNFLWKHGVRDFGDFDLAEMQRKGGKFQRAVDKAFYEFATDKKTVTTLAPEELAVAREIQDYLKEWADRLHLPEDNRISHYITHIFEREVEAPNKEGIGAFDDQELAALMRDQPAGSVYDPFLEKRIGKKGYKEDVWAALDVYVKRATRKEAMDPALEALKNVAVRLDEQSYKYVATYSHRVNMRPTELENLVDNLVTQSGIGYRFGARPTTVISSRIRNLFYRGTLGLNFGSALRNLTQGVNTYAELGEKYTVIGYSKLVYRLMARDLSELYDTHVLEGQFVEDKKVGVYKSIMQKLDPMLFSMFEGAEMINRGAAYFGAKSRALDRGMTEDEAIREAKRIVRKTQFAFGAIDTPVVFNDDVVKTLTQLQTYSIKQIEFLGTKAIQRDFVGLLRYVLGSYVALNTIGTLFGMTVGQLMPTVGVGGAPLSSIAGNLIGLFTGNEQEKAKAASNLKRSMWTFVPAGAQLRKTILGLEAYYAGKDVTPTGKTRFVIPHNAGNLLKSALFGKSSLPQARSYYDALGEPKIDSTDLSSPDERTFIQKVSNYAEAIGTDPVTAFGDILTGNTIQRTTNGAIIVRRLPLAESRAIKAQRGSTAGMRLDHTIPLELGGTNNPGNLKLVTTQQWASYTAIENLLGKALTKGTINGKRAQQLIKDFKVGKITADQVRAAIQ